MKINIEKFKEYVKKATLNNSFESIQINFDKNEIQSSMTNKNYSAICKLLLKNDIFTGIKDDKYTLNFVEPNINLMPFINLYVDEVMDFDIKDGKFIIKQGRKRSSISIAMEKFVFSGNTDIQGLIPINEKTNILFDFVETFNDIKKISTKFGKIYLNVENNILYMEATDKENSASNSLRIELFPVKDIKDVILCFDFKDLYNLIKLVADDSDKYIVKLSYKNINNKNIGLININNKDESEKYYLMGKSENY